MELDISNSWEFYIVPRFDSVLKRAAIFQYELQETRISHGGFNCGSNNNSLISELNLRLRFCQSTSEFNYLIKGFAKGK
ncbi:unnamed protein product [Tenebrio molitor]|nr:unnamed protein product [Tenebrio molitor]